MSVWTKYCVCRWRGKSVAVPTYPRLGHDGNRPEILKYSVSVPNVPGSNYRDSFTVPDFSTPTLLWNCRYSGQVIQLIIL